MFPTRYELSQLINNSITRNVRLLNLTLMNWFVKILISSLAVMLSAWLLPGIQIDDYFTGIAVALVLALLNTFLKPLLVIITLPITVFTLGLFLLVINALIIMMAGNWISGFVVDGFWWALIFSFVLSFITSLMEGLGETSKN